LPSSLSLSLSLSLNNSHSRELDGTTTDPSTTRSH
jgi:hypothetical protein